MTDLPGSRDAYASKNLSGLLQLNNHLTGIILSNGKFQNDNNCHVFLNSSDQFRQDSNKTVTQLVKVLIHTQQQLGWLPKKLFLQHDSCVKDLKNQYLLAFYWILVDVERKIFEEVMVSMMPIGHTHNYVDRYFSQIASKLQKLEIPCFEYLVKAVSEVEAYGRPPYVHE